MQESEHSEVEGKENGQGVKDLVPESARGLLKDFWLKAKAVLMHPKQFFQSMPKEGDYRDPLIFLCIAAGGNAILSVLIGFSLMNILFFPATFIGVFLGAYIANFLAQTMGGKGTFKSTFWVMAYSEAALIFSWVPLLGVIGSLYVLSLNYLGLKQIHELTDFKAVVVVLLSGIFSGMVFLLAACGLWARSIFHF